MRKEKILSQFENSKMHKDLYGKLLWLSGKRCFPIQIFLIFGGRCSHNFWNTELKLYRLLTLICSFSSSQNHFFLNKLISCLQKVNHVTQVS